MIDEAQNVTKEWDNEDDFNEAVEDLEIDCLYLAAIQKAVEVLEELHKRRQSLRRKNMIISFRWTSAALLAGVKTVTRREWSTNYAQRFHAGDRVDAYNDSPRVKGHKIASIRLTQDPYQEYARDMPWSDFMKEGLAWMAGQAIDIQGLSPRAFWRRWRERNPLLWVVRFEIEGIEHARTQ